MIVILVIWNLILSGLILTVIAASYNNADEIERIKSWYPFCEILKIKIPEKDDFEWEKEEEDGEA